MHAALENESRVPTETKINFWEINFPKYSSIQKYACFVRACFSSPFQQLASTYKMVANAVKISGTDVISQINAWCDNPILDLKEMISFSKVLQGLITICDVLQCCETVEFTLLNLFKIYYLTTIWDILMKSSQGHRLSWWLFQLYCTINVICVEQKRVTL